MRQATLSPNARLTDTLERDVVRGAINRQAPVNVRGFAARAGRRALNAVVATVRFFDEVNADMERARQRQSLRSGSDW